RVLHGALGRIPGGRIRAQANGADDDGECHRKDGHDIAAPAPEEALGKAMELGEAARERLGPPYSSRGSGFSGSVIHGSHHIPFLALKHSRFSHKLESV